MFIVFLKFSDNRTRAAELMEGHNSWIKQGFDDGVFLLVGSLQPSQGGAVVAYNTSMAELETRVNQDPFVVENVVSAEIVEISAARADSRLSFLVD